MRWICGSIILLGVVLGTPSIARQTSPSKGGEAPAELPSPQIVQLGLLRLWHFADAQLVLFSPDGKWLASAHNDEVILWDAASEKAKHRFQIPPQSYYPRPYSLAFSPNGRYLAGAFGGPVHVWETATGKLARLLCFEPDVRTRYVAFVPGTTIFPGQSTLLMAGMKTVRLVHLDPDGDALQFTSHKELGRLALSPDGELLADGDRDEIRLWDVHKGQVVRRLDGAGDRALAFSPDGKLLAASCTVTAPDRGTFYLSDVATGKEVRDLPRRGAISSGLAFAGDNKVMASSWAGDAVSRLGGTLCISEVATGRLLRHFPVPAVSVAFSPCCKRLAVVGATVELTAILTRLQAGPSGPVQSRHLEALWSDLASPIGVGCKDYEAMWALVAASEDAVTFLKERLRPIPPVDPKHLARLIGDLDSDQFAVREAASAELEALGERAKRSLENALRGQPTPEQRRRIEKLLPKLLDEWPPPDQVRPLRAIEALAHIATPDARSLLQELAKGSPSARQTQYAQAAIDWLAWLDDQKGK